MDSESTKPHVKTQETHHVFDIKRFALHDGPGIRTTAFLKGCPLSCIWCQNPEGITARPVLWYAASRCIGCGKCVEICPSGALSPAIDIDRYACTRCGACVTACPSGALHWDSREYTARELAEQLLKDAVFYESSGGGITLSGGEPMACPDFSLEVLDICGSRGFHTAIETSLFASRKTVNRFIPLTDLFLADLKIIDDEAHRKHTGVSNRLILENLRHVAKAGKALIVRVPLIPGITDTRENIEGISRFVSALEEDVPVELLSFNPLAESKYRTLGLPYPFADVLSQQTAGEVEELKTILKENQCRVL